MAVVLAGLVAGVALLHLMVPHVAHVEVFTCAVIAAPALALFCWCTIRALGHRRGPSAIDHFRAHSLQAMIRERPALRPAPVVLCNLRI